MNCPQSHILLIASVIACLLQSVVGAADEFLLDGSRSACGKVCKLVCETKKFTAIGYGSECKDICIPEPSRKGCKHCANNQHQPVEAILARFRKIHGDNYSYDNTLTATFKVDKKTLTVTPDPQQVTYGQADRVTMFDVPSPLDRQRLAETIGINAAKLSTVMDETNRKGAHWSTMYHAHEHQLYRLPPFELT